MIDSEWVILFLCRGRLRRGRRWGWRRRRGRWGGGRRPRLRSLQGQEPTGVQAAVVIMWGTLSLSLDLTSTDQNNLSWNSRCVYCNFSHFLSHCYSESSDNVTWQICQKRVRTFKRRVFCSSILPLRKIYWDDTIWKKNMLPIILESIVPKCTTTCHVLAISHTIKWQMSAKYN